MEEKYTQQTIAHDTGVVHGRAPLSNERVPLSNRASSGQRVEYLVYFIFGMIEALLAFRFILKLAGANASSSFVSFIYSFSGIFTWPFEGIFRAFFGQGVETTSVFEPSTLVAILAYAIIGWGVVKLIDIFTGEHQN